MARLMCNTLSRKNPYRMPKPITRMIYHLCLGYRDQDPVDQELIRNTVDAVTEDPVIRDAVFKAVTEGKRYKDFNLSDTITDKMFYRLIRRFYYILARRARIWIN